MTTTFIIQTILEILTAVLIVVGFIFEEKVIVFEDKVWNFIKRKVKALIKSL